LAAAVKGMAAARPAVERAAVAAAAAAAVERAAVAAAAAAAKAVAVGSAGG
jgi:hypothetical protein